MHLRAWYMPRWWRPNRRLMVLLAITLLVCFTHLAFASTAVAASTDRQIRADQRFRLTFGLRSDEGHIRDVHRQAGGTVVAYGVRLTQHEERELSTRFFELDALKRAAQAYVAHMQIDEFGGMFIDQRAGGILYVQVTHGAKGHAARLRARAPYTERLRVIMVRTSAHELDEVHRRIIEDMPMLQRRVVQVGVEEPSRRAVSLLERRYGGARVAVRKGFPTGTESRSDDPPPFQAGYALRDSATAVDDCTMAFSAYKYVPGAPQYYQLTAGHCAPDGMLEGAAQYHSSTLMGTIAENSLAISPIPPAIFAYTNSDAASISIAFANHGNRLYHEGDPTARITQVEVLDTDVEGDPVCQSAKDSQVACGEILSVDHSAATGVDPHIVIEHTRKADYIHEQGDSGAAVFAPVAGGGYEAMGVHHGRDPSDNKAVYSHIGHVLSDLGLDGVYTSQVHQVLQDGPAAYYRLGEKNSTASSAGSVTGTYKDVGYSASGPLPADPSAVFRGGTNDSSVEVGAYGAFDLPGSFTLEAWINPTAYVSGAGNGIIYKGTSGGAPAHYLYGGNYNLTLQSNGTIRFAFQYQDPGDPSALNSYTVTTPATAEGKAPLGLWTYVVAVYDASGANCANKMAIYLNGVQRACGPTVGAAQYGPWTNANPFRIARRAESASNANGLTDEAAIYSYALSPFAISDHYGARTNAASYKVAVLVAAPAAYYELNDAPRLKNQTANAAEGTYIAYDGYTLGHPGVFDDPDTAGKFSGNARGEVDGGNAYVNQSGDFTIEAWVNPANVSSGTRTIVSKGATGSNGGNYWLLTNGNDFSFWYQTQLASCTTNCTATNHIITWPTSKSAVVGQWYHVAAAVDKCDFPATECYAKLYVNGVLEGSKSMKDGSGNILAPKTNTYPFRIGLAGANSTVYSFGGGTIDEVAIYSKVLDSTAIQAHYFPRQ
jgi:hypothetical protein